MTDNNLPASDRLLKSLDSISELHHSARRSALLMVVGVLIVIGAMLYSFTKLAPLERQVNQLELDIKTKQNTDEALKQTIREDQIKAADLERKITILQRQEASQRSLLRTIGAKADVDPQVAKAIPRVYIHIGSERQRSGARRLVARLQQAGFLVPSVELYPEMPAHTDVRYYPTTGVRSDYTSIMDIMRSEKIPARLNPLSNAPTSRQGRPRHYEIWFGQDSL